MRREELRLVNQSGEMRVIPKPLFGGDCEWRVIEENDGTILTAKLNLKINPTRYVRHRQGPIALPDSLLERSPLSAPIIPEICFDGNDNWFPLSGRLFAAASPSRWRGHLSRYLSAIETGFTDELTRACSVLPGHVSCHAQRGASHYNVTHVETYWEWLSDDPLKVVSDLWSLLRKYSARKRTVRLYKVEIEASDESDLFILQVEISPYETLKIYAKTTLRIRIEVSHLLAGENSFRFPATCDGAGNQQRSTAHTFRSRPGVLNFLDRIRERGAGVVNEFLSHCAEHATIPLSHISAYHLLAAITNAVPDFKTASSIASLLINRGTLAAHSESESYTTALAALAKKGVITRRPKRNLYHITKPYRQALRALHLHANFPLLLPHRWQRPHDGDASVANPQSRLSTGTRQRTRPLQN